MSTRVLTLFGEELIPEKPKPVRVNPPREAIVPDPVIEELVSEEEEATGEKLYYSIGEVAKLFNVRTSHIRFWTKSFQLKVRTTRKGDRLYNPERIADLRTIYDLIKVRGFTIPGAKAHIKASKTKGLGLIELKQALLQIRNQLIAIRDELS